jgi:hypothetical protein
MAGTSWVARMAGSSQVGQMVELVRKEAHMETRKCKECGQPSGQDFLCPNCREVWEFIKAQMDKDCNDCCESCL